MRGERIEVFPAPNGKWYWHHKAANNEIVDDSGQGYADKDNAWEAAERRRKNSPEIPIFEVEE